MTPPESPPATPSPGPVRLPTGAEAIIFGFYNDVLGTFYQMPNAETGEFHYCFVVETRHLNASGTAHGGMLMSFADISMSRTARLGSGARASTTISMSCDFVSPARLGDVVEARVRVTRHTRSVVFLMGDLLVSDSRQDASPAQPRPILTATGVWKIV